MPGSGGARLGWVARSVTDLVGDGCLIRTLDPSNGALAPRAAAHRDPDRRGALERLRLAGPLERPAGGWLRQALASGSVVHLPDAEPQTLLDAGLPTDERTGEVVITPIAPGRTVIVAVRDRLNGAYSPADRRTLRRIAAAAAPSLASGWTHARIDHQLELVSSAVWITDPTGVTTYVNQSACALVGLPAERIVGVPIAEFIDGTAPAPGRPGFFGEAPADRALLGADGHTRWISIVSRPLFDRRGGDDGRLYTLTDITERRRHEIDLRTRLDVEQALGRFAELLVVEDDRQRIASRAVELVAEQFAAPLVTVVDVSRDRTEAEPLACAGTLSEEDPDRWRARCELPEGSATAAAIETNESVRVDDFVAGRPHYQPGPIARSAAARSAACVPIAAGRGCLAVCRGEAGGVEDRELELLEAVGRLLSKRWPRP